jgi:LPXTG-motif cell wall-anchored protein
MAAFRTVFPDIHWVIEEMVAEGDYLAALLGVALIGANSLVFLRRRGR